MPPFFQDFAVYTHFDPITNVNEPNETTNFARSKQTHDEQNGSTVQSGVRATTFLE